MKKQLTLLFISMMTPSLFAAVPTPQNMREFLTDFSEPLGITINGGNFNSSAYLSGIPHFNLESGVTALECEIKNPVGEGNLKTSISVFYAKATFGLFKGFNPTTSWKGFMGIETGIKGYGSPLFGTLNKYKEKSPFGLSLTGKLNLLKNKGLIPAFSFFFDYNSLLSMKFQFIDRQTHEKANSSINMSTFAYHLELRESLPLVDIYTGFAWLTPSMKGTYTINDYEREINYTQGTLTQFHFGIAVPVELIDVNLEVGKAGKLGYYGAALGFRM